MAIYSDLSSRLLRLLGDPDAKTYDEEVVYDGLLHAHTAILSWIPKLSKHQFTSGSAGDVFALPSDCYEVQAVQVVETGKFLPRATLAPNTIRGEDLATVNDWIVYPDGYLSLSLPLDEGDLLNLYYYAYWNTPTSPTNTTFVIEVPQMGHRGMLLYAASYAIMPQAMNAAGIRQYATRIDSGNPEDNPLERASEYFLKRFFAEMKLVPPFVRAGQ
jgi:hypothetical protein